MTRKLSCDLYLLDDGSLQLDCNGETEAVRKWLNAALAEHPNPAAGEHGIFAVGREPLAPTTPSHGAMELARRRFGLSAGAAADLIDPLR